MPPPINLIWTNIPPLSSSSNQSSIYYSNTNKTNHSLLYTKSTSYLAEILYQFIPWIIGMLLLFLALFILLNHRNIFISLILFCHRIRASTTPEEITSWSKMNQDGESTIIIFINNNSTCIIDLSMRRNTITITYHHLTYNLN